MRDMEEFRESEKYPQLCILLFVGGGWLLDSELKQFGVVRLEVVSKLKLMTRCCL